MKLVFIVGKKRSGKDTAVEFINENFNTFHYKLAYPIKWALEKGWNHLQSVSSHSSFKLTSEDWDGSGIDREKNLPLSNSDVVLIMMKAIEFLTIKHGLKRDHEYQRLIEEIVLNNTEAWSIRRLMQTLGTDLVVNKFDRMFWVKLFANVYADEFDKDYDYFIVPDTRQDHELSFARAMGATVIHVVRDGSGSEDTHITEARLPIGPTDVVIENNDTLEEFKSKIVEAIETL